MRTGLVAVRQALEQSSCLVAWIRVGHDGIPNPIANVDLLGTDYDDTIWHDTELIRNINHPLISAQPWGGINLLPSDFDLWGPTDLGSFVNLPTTQHGYQEILFNKDAGTDRVTMFEYDYGHGHVLVDTLSSIDGGWGTGNGFVANNSILYLNYLPELHQFPIVLDQSVNQTIKEFTTGNRIFWEISDTDPDVYTIELDGIPINSGNWTSPQTLYYNVDGNSIGIYNYTLILRDLEGHVSSQSVFVEVIDGTPPVFTEIQTPKTIVPHHLTIF